MESGATSYPYPQQVSEVNSLWSIEQCRKGKTAKWIRNFGTRIGSKGRGGRAAKRDGGTGRRGGTGQSSRPSRATGWCRGPSLDLPRGLPSDRSSCEAASGTGFALGSSGVVLFVRRATVNLELARTWGIRLSN